MSKAKRNDIHTSNVGIFVQCCQMVMFALSSEFDISTQFDTCEQLLKILTLSTIPIPIQTSAAMKHNNYDYNMYVRLFIAQCLSVAVSL